MGVLGHFAPETHFAMEVLGYFVLNNQTKKIDKIHKHFKTKSSVHVKFSMSKCTNILKLNIASKKNQHILVWKYQQYM